MKFIVRKTENLQGEAVIPGNKSGTARAIILGSLSKGRTFVKKPLLNLDSFSIINMFREIGAEIDTTNSQEWVIEGVGKDLKVPANVLDAENSGTGYYMTTAVLSLIDGISVIAGDYQICSRPAQPLIDALNDLGANVFSTRGSGTAPLVIEGIIKGGEVEMPGTNSQWMTPLMIAGSLAPEDTTINISGPMHEIPYIKMTMGMLKKVGVNIKHKNFQKYYIKGNQEFSNTNFDIPGDWGTAGYPMIATAITNSKVEFKNLDINTYAGETEFVNILKKFGADVEVIDEGDGGIIIEGGNELEGKEIDCSGTPDAVPILAVLGCYAKGKTVLKNIKASRMKETDRTAIIRKELEKMGGKFEETEDSLTIYHSKLHGNFIDGHHDHRIVLATSIAGLIAEEPTVISNAEYVKVSFPNFYELMSNLGANIELLEEV